MTIIEGFEAYSLNSWLDRGMSVQVKRPAVWERRANKASQLISRIAASTALVVGVAVTNFAWAGESDVPFSSIKPPSSQPVDVSAVQVPAGYVESLMARLSTGPRIPDDDQAIADPDSFF